MYLKRKLSNTKLIIINIITTTNNIIATPTGELSLGLSNVFMMINVMSLFVKNVLLTGCYVLNETVLTDFFLCQFLKNRPQIIQATVRLLKIYFK